MKRTRGDVSEREREKERGRETDETSSHPLSTKISASASTGRDTVKPLSPRVELSSFRLWEEKTKCDHI